MKFGRLPRRFDPAVPHMSALVSGQSLPPPPSEVTWQNALPSDLGMMLNDTLGDCTCAAVYHAIQLWTANAKPPIATEPDECVEKLYEVACGYNPSNPSTDQGGDEQTVLSYWVKNGIPRADLHRKTPVVQKLAAFVEVDTRNIDDIKRAIADCGLVYIGFNVPAFVENLEDPGSVWDVEPSSDNTIVGGHAVILVGYNSQGATLVSWGSLYTMTWPFFSQFVDEAYALADVNWIEVKGTTPAGLSLSALEAQMQAIKGSSSNS